MSIGKNYCDLKDYANRHTVMWATTCPLKAEKRSNGGWSDSRTLLFEGCYQIHRLQSDANIVQALHQTPPHIAVNIEIGI
jgi:hypothetical protein